MHPRRFATGLQDEFVDIIAEMMEKDLVRRTQTCAEVANRLEPWANQESAISSYPSMSRSPWAAPPPPATEEPNAVADDNLQETSFPSHDTNASSSLGGGLPNGKKGIAAPPLPMNSDLVSPNAYNLPDTEKRSSTQSIFLTVALTAAVLLPPALLIGAILGYLIAIRS